MRPSTLTAAYALGVCCFLSATYLFPSSHGAVVNKDSSTQKPNFLVLFIDDMGYSDLAAYGSPNVSTPFIDSLVDSGVKLTQWISAASICTPSRAALQTGRYPIRTGCMGNVERYRVVPTPSNPSGLDPATQVSIAAALKDAGYATGMSGKWHLESIGTMRQTGISHPPATGMTATTAALTRTRPCARWMRVAYRSTTQLVPSSALRRGTQRSFSSRFT